METLEFILVIIAAYVMGSLSISIFMSRHVLGRDIRRAGSGNAGATNMARVYGMSAGVLTLGGDMCKTAAAMLLGYLVLGDRGMAAAGMACMAGHCYPLLHGFKGGKGVSAGAAMALCIDWRAGLLTIAVFAIAALCSKKVSFGSICAALSLPGMGAGAGAVAAAVRSGDSWDVSRRHTAQGEYKAPDKRDGARFQARQE